MKLETFQALARAKYNFQWIVEGLISPGGWTFLVGDPKIGKSILTLQLCEALQEGKEFLGRKTSQKNCLYLQSDAGLAEWQEQIKRIAGDSYAWTAHQLDKGFIDEEDERKRLREIVWGEYSIEIQGEGNYKALTTILQNKPFEFIVFDCLHTITNGDINTKIACNEVTKHINEIVTKRIIDDRGEAVTIQIPYILIHHPNNTQKIGTTSGAGWKGLSGDCTTKLNLLPSMLILEGSKLTSREEILLGRDRVGRWIVPFQGGDEDYEGLSDDIALALNKRRNHTS
jgi:AAA domain-containing protein